jgi:hypothetical protein
VVSLVFILPAEYFVYFVIWLLGVAASKVNIRFTNSVFGFVFLLLALAGSRIGPLSAYFRELVLGIACAVLISIVRNRGGFPLRFAEFHRRMSAFSYSVYIFHFPLVVLLISVITQSGNLGVDVAMPARFALFGAISLLCLTASYALSLITEAKTGALRKYLFSCLAPASQKVWFVTRLHAATFHRCRIRLFP